ncbi:MAG TPA: hypothetical protein DCE56_45145 [Cyanobacteria bacterium UBA8553]|nr:hypothetical protein [Cyanobacteria bacterium UBA8553]HAJ61383.1 hypothetical protein [Cyanobacteria bacterium UBA8543]
MGDSVSKQLSLGDSTIRAQVLNLDRWLIPQQHPDIPRFTSGNQVDPLIDGQRAFRAMHDAFTTAAPEQGYIYITGWDIVPAIHLLGRTGGAAVQLDTVLGTARSSGVDVRILLFYVNALRRYPIITWESFLWARIFTDNKTRGRTGSHHQKTAAVRTREGLVSFVGGIDLTTDRWDTSAHCHPDPDADYQGTGQPWHDVHARVRGPAAADIETNFRHRWNDRHPNPVDQVPVHPTPAPLANGTHIVQTLRTFPNNASRLGTAWPYNFAPNGEFGLRRGYLNAIGNARDYIYIEDQYIVGDDISTAIAAVMRRSERLQVILVTSPAPDMFVDAFDFHQNEFVRRLRAVDASRVQIFHLENRALGRCASLGTPGGTGIYCHTKVCIIDDIWAIIGSCNTNRRSLTHDSEISIAILDQTIERGRRKFARDLRIALWVEHLGLTSAELPLIDDPIVGTAEWRSRAGRSPAHAVVHTRPAGSNSRFWDSDIDPDGLAPP